MDTGHLFSHLAQHTRKRAKTPLGFSGTFFSDRLAPFASLTSFFAYNTQLSHHIHADAAHFLTRTSTYSKTPSPPHPSRSRTPCIAVTERRKHVQVVDLTSLLFGCKVSAEPSDRILDRRESSSFTTFEYVEHGTRCCTLRFRRGSLERKP
jgi:hypothetical protein